MAYLNSSLAIFGQVIDTRGKLFTAWMLQQIPCAPLGSYTATISQLDEVGAIENLGKLPFMMVDKAGKTRIVNRFVYRLAPKYLSVTREEAIRMLGSAEKRSSEFRWIKGGKR